MEHPFYPEFSYDTPEGVKRYISDYVWLYTRVPFYFRFWKQLNGAKKDAFNNKLSSERAAEISFSILNDIERSGGKVHIRGLEHVANCGKPAVIIANHMSTMETVMLPSILNPIRPASFVIKEKLVKGSFFGPIMRALEPITVTRKSPREDLTAVLTQGAKLLEEGRSVIVFPEGTRSHSFNREAFSSIGIKLASRTGAPVIPLALKTDFWGDGKILRGLGGIKRKEESWFEFGEPINVSGRGKAEHEQVVDFIEGRLKEWKYKGIQ